MIENVSLLWLYYLDIPPHRHYSHGFLYHDTPAVTQAPEIWGIIRGTDPFSLLERRAKGNGEPF